MNILQRFVNGAINMLPIAMRGAAPASPTRDAMRDAIAYVDPTRLFNAQMFLPFNPSMLVTRKGLAVFDAMGLDEQVKSALAFKIMSVLAGGWEVVSPGDEEDDWEVTVFVRESLEQFPGGWNLALKKMMRALKYGYCALEKVYEERDRGPLKGKLALDRLVELKPHYVDFEMDKSGKVISIVQLPLPGGAGEPFNRYPPEKFVHYAYDIEFENPYGKSDLEAAYRAWWVKDNAYKWYAIMLERYGIPPLFALYDPNHYQDANLEQLKKVVRNIQAATMGMIPRQTKEGLEFWSQALAAGSREIFSSALARFDADIAKAILQPSLTGFAQESGSQGAQSGGSLARANVSWRSFMMVVRELQADLAASAVNSQIIPQMCDLNFANLTAYPLFRFARLDEDKELELFKLWSEMVAGGVVNRIEDDERHIRKSLDMPPNDKIVIKPLPQKTPPFGGADGAQPGQGEELPKVPEEKLTQEMRAFADERAGEWVYLNGHPVCFERVGEYALSPAAARGIWARYKDDEHPHAACVADFGGKVSDPHAFCAAVERDAAGTSPAERAKK